MTRLLLRILLLTVVPLILIGTVALVWHGREQRIGYYTDADTIRTPASTTSPRDVLWQPPLPIEGSLNTATDEYEPRVTADGLTMFFVRGQPGENADILTCVRTPDGWAEPTSLDAVNTDAAELGPELSADGQTLYFYSDRPGGLGGYDLWASSFLDGAWQEPFNLGAGVNSSFNDYGPALTPDGTKLYFASNRPQMADATSPDPHAWEATVREDLYQRDYDLFVSVLTDRGAGPASPVLALNGPSNEGSPAVSPVGDYLYFTSDRAGGEGGFDIYRCRLLDGGYRDLRNLGSTVNTASNELDPTLDMGGFGLLFSSDRSLAETDARPSYNLYRTTSREVFLEHETYRAAIDWDLLAPYLLWGLLASLLLLLLLLLRRLMMSKRFHTLGLLARCLLVSLAAHIIMMILLGFWSVGSSFSDWLSDGGGVQVALVSPSVGQDVASQIRGGLSDVMVTPLAQTVTQQDLRVPQPPAAMETEITEVRQARLEVERLARSEPTPTGAPLPTHQAELPNLEAPQTALLAAVGLPEAATPVATEESRRSSEPNAQPAQPTQKAAGPPETRDVQMAAVETRVPQHTAEDAGESLAQEHVPTDIAPRHLAFRPVETQTQQLPSAMVLKTQLAVAPEAPMEPRQEAERAVRTASRHVERLEPAETQTPALNVAPADTALLRANPVEIRSTSVADLNIPTTDAPARMVESGASVPAPLPLIAASQQFRIDDLPEDMHAPSDEELSHITAKSEALTRREPVRASSASTEAAPTIETSTQLAQVSAPAQHLVRAEAVDVPAGLMPTLGPIASPIVTPQRQESLSLRLPEVAEQDHHLEAADAPEHRAVTQTPGTSQRAELPPATAVTETAHFRPVLQDIPDRDRPLDQIAAHSAWRVDPVAALADAPSDETLIISPLDPVAAATPAGADESPQTEELRRRIAPRTIASAPRAATEGATAWIQPNAPHSDVSDSLRDDLAEPAGVRPLGRTAPRQSERDTDEPLDSESGILALVEVPPAVNLALRLPTQVAPPVREIGIVRGVVTDARTNQPLTSATIRLDLAEADPLLAVTDDQGRYELAVPDIPDFVAISASHNGYDPSSVNVPAEQLKRRTVERDFALTPSRQDVIVIESDPEVHHLGDNAFSGAINSRFQKRSEGRRFQSTFQATAEQFESDSRDAVIRLLVRGTERDNRIRINGHTVPTPLNDSPRDGRFGTFVTTFPLSWLNEGSNTLIIESAWADSAHSDLDDFEFVNIQIHLPVQIAPVRNSYSQRSRENREDMLQAHGGSARTERAVERSLRWLAEHQSDDGRWDGDGFDDDRGASAGYASFDVDIATTGASLLCFLSAGHTHVTDGPYRETVGRALTWLLRQQTPDGSLMGPESMYSHAVATMALAEALAMTEDGVLQQPVAAAVQFTMSARDPEGGGWSHAPSQPGNTAALGWQVMALTAAHNAGVDVPPDVFAEAGRWLDLVQSVEVPGAYAYEPGGPASVEITAEAMYVRQLLGGTTDSPEMQAAVRYILENRPSWEADANTYLWHFATLALFQQGGEDWQRWNGWIVDELVANQVRRGPAAGSWPVADEWSAVGGRIYQTAICTLTLETYYRYAPPSER
jgi:WD40-like Beta Propeller Repeat